MTIAAIHYYFKSSEFKYQKQIKIILLLFFSTFALYFLLARLGFIFPLRDVAEVPQGSDEMIDNQQNWTLGCPSLKNKDVEELYKVVKIGTLIEVVQ